MRDRHHGHPLGGTLIIGAIFSVALAFYLASPAAVPQPASVQWLLSMHAAPIPSHPPAIVPHAASRHVAAQPAEPIAREVEEVAQAEAPAASVAESVAITEPALRAFSWSTVPSTYPPAASRVTTAGPSTFALRASADKEGPAPRTAGEAANGGAVTHAFATAGSAIRSAFSKVF